MYVLNMLSEHESCCDNQISLCASEKWNGVSEFAYPLDMEENELFYALNSRYYMYMY